jgi:hypothetical protein
VLAYESFDYVRWAMAINSYVSKYASVEVEELE